MNPKIQEHSFGEKLILLSAVTAAIILAFGVFGVISYFASPKAPSSSTDQKIVEIQKDLNTIKEQINLSDYSKKDTLKKAIVASNFRNSVKNNKPNATIEKTILVTENISYGYLYVKASVPEGSLLPYDSIYVKLASNLNSQYTEIGGHLRRDKSFEVPKNSSSTEVLYDLQNVFYKASVPYDEKTTAISADFLKLLNEGQGTKIISFTSTLREGTISELSFYYECESQTQCSIEVQK